MLVLGAARIIGDTYHSGTLMPTAANTQDIGSETMPWRWVYAQYLYGDGSHIININAENIDQGVLSTARIPNLSWNKITSDKPDYVTRWPKWNEIAQSGAENLSEGGSDLTDNTEILTSYASNSGFNDTHAQGVVYKRDAIHVYNYIKGKLDSIYATQATVDGLLSAANAMIFQGTLGTGGTITALPATHNAGWTYRVITAGTYAGKYCEVGTLIICIKDGTVAADADWTSVETNEDGAVIGPSSATDNAIAVFNGNTGRIIKNGQYVTYLNHAAANAGTNKVGYIDGLMITGDAYGNPGDLVSNKEGQLSYGDAGPQIRFNSSGQLGAIIFDHYDSTSGMGTSFNFVTNQSNTAIKADGLIAKTRAMIGGNSVNGSYVLYSNGKTYINGETTINGNLIFPQANVLDWNQGTYRQRITITDDSTTDTAVFTFQQSVNSGTSYADLFTIKDNGTVVANTFEGNATTATTASRLTANTSFSYSDSGLTWFDINGTAGAEVQVNDTPTSAWWHILRFNHSYQNGYYTDLAIPFNAKSLYYKRISNDAVADNKWVKVLDEDNYTSYTVTKNGTGATGTWGISISGNAATATKIKDDGTTAQFWRGDNAWSDTISGGILKIANNGNTVSIGSQNSSFTHIYNSTNVSFVFNKSILSADATASLGNTALPFHQLVLGGATSATMTAASTNPRITFQEGTSTSAQQPVHIVYTDYNNYREPAGLKVVGGSSASPAWFEVEGDVFARKHYYQEHAYTYYNDDDQSIDFVFV